MPGCFLAVVNIGLDFLIKRQKKKFPKENLKCLSPEWMQTTSVYSYSPIAIKGATTEGYCYFRSMPSVTTKNRNSLGLS